MTMKQISVLTTLFQILFPSQEYWAVFLLFFCRSRQLLFCCCCKAWWGGASSIPSPPLCGGSSSFTVLETAASPSSSCVPTVVLATDDIHHSQQSVASSSTRPGEGDSSSLQGMSSSSSSVTNINKDAAEIEGDIVNIDLNNLIERISQRLELIQVKCIAIIDIDMDTCRLKTQPTEWMKFRFLLFQGSKKSSERKGAQQYWPTASKTFFKLKEFLSEGINVVVRIKLGPSWFDNS